MKSPRSRGRPGAQASSAGLFEKTVSCGDTIGEGDVIGRYFDIWGNPAGDMRAPKGGVVLAINGGPIIGQGETLIHIGLDPRPA